MDLGERQGNGDPEVLRPEDVHVGALPEHEVLRRRHEDPGDRENRKACAPQTRRRRGEAEHEDHEASGRDHPRDPHAAAGSEHMRRSVDRPLAPQVVGTTELTETALGREEPDVERHGQDPREDGDRKPDAREALALVAAHLGERPEPQEREARDRLHEHHTGPVALRRADRAESHESHRGSPPPPIPHPRRGPREEEAERGRGNLERREPREREVDRHEDECEDRDRRHARVAPHLLAEAVEKRHRRRAACDRDEAHRGGVVAEERVRDRLQDEEAVRMVHVVLRRQRMLRRVVDHRREHVEAQHVLAGHRARRHGRPVPPEEARRPPTPRRA